MTRTLEEAAEGLKALEEEMITTCSRQRTMTPRTLHYTSLRLSK